MEAWLHDRIEASTDPYLPSTLPKQNQHHSKQGKNVMKTRVYIQQESAQRKKANRLKANVQFVQKNIEFTSAKAMNDLEKFNTIKANKLCHDSFQRDHFTSRCKSKNTCFKNHSSAKHHTTLH